MDKGVPASPSGYSAEPEPEVVSAAVAVSIPNAANPWTDGAIDADVAAQFTRMCTAGDEEDDDTHWACPCIVSHARKIMWHWTGTNCTFVDDDITALGILASKAVHVGLHHGAKLPKSLISAIDKHLASGMSAFGQDPRSTAPDCRGRSPMNAIRGFSASGMEARRAAAENTDAVHDSPTLEEGDAPPPPGGLNA